MTISEERFSALEQRVSKLEIQGAVDNERYGAIVQRLNKIDGHLSRIMMTIITSLLAAIVMFIVNGGLRGI